MQVLHAGGRILTPLEDKKQEVLKHFKANIGTASPRTCSLNWAELGIEPMQLEHLDDSFTEEEIRAAIFSSLGNKAPRA